MTFEILIGRTQSMAYLYLSFVDFMPVFLMCGHFTGA